jgi:hypothetical protein
MSAKIHQMSLIYGIKTQDGVFFSLRYELNNENAIWLGEVRG